MRFGKSNQVVHGRGAWGQNEDDWRNICRVSQSSLKIEGWTLDEERAQLFLDVLLESGNHLLVVKDLHEHCLLEVVKAVLVDSRKIALLRSLRVHVLSPSWLVGCIGNGSSNVFESCGTFLKSPETPPLLIAEDGCSLVLLVFEVGGRSSQEEVPLVDCDGLVTPLDGRRVQERVKELVFLEETTADALIEGPSYILY